MLTFTAAIFFLLITPGPGVLSTAGVGAAFGYRSGLVYVAGLCIGTNLVALAVVSGLAALILASPAIRTIMFAASTLYLLYLALRIAFAGSKIAFIEARKVPGIPEALLLQALNPKAYAVNTTLFFGFPLFPDQITLEIMIKFVIINAIWIPIHLLWLWAGAMVQQLDLAESTQRLINRAMAASMLLVVALAALSAW